MIRQIEKDAHHFREIIRQQEKQFFADQVLRKQLNPFRLPRMKQKKHIPNVRCDDSDEHPDLVSELTCSNLKVCRQCNK